jgi:hypothetical protein
MSILKALFDNIGSMEVKDEYCAILEGYTTTDERLLEKHIHLMIHCNKKEYTKRIIEIIMKEYPEMVFKATDNSPSRNHWMDEDEEIEDS